MLKDFTGKVAVITGGASGIGRGYALAFAKRGMKIVLADIDKEALDKVSKELVEIGAEVMTVITDVSDHKQVAHLADASYERFGIVNILCNNAGVGGGGPMRLMTLENWNWVLGVNLFGVIYGIQYFLNRMLKSKEPCHIVNTSSLAGLLTGDAQPYSASKHAVVSISEILDLECFNTNVGVSVVCPGYVNTNIVKNTEIISKTRSGLWEPTPEMIKLAGPNRENFEKILALGMDPEFMAEIVIRAIENDIFYVITHPEFIPALEARFERIYDDTLKLHEGAEAKREIKTKTFQNDSPGFSITYPENLIELKPNPNPAFFPKLKPIFVGTTVNPGFDLLIFVSKISPKRRLEDMAKRIAKNHIRSREVKIVSNKQIYLGDGTPAYECVIEYKAAGVFKGKSIHLSVFKDEKWIRVSVFTRAKYYNKDL
jgi:NAD(P)-dependent dehydrogenase (short-subunit alcohol dehydrogenase family)